MLVIATDCVGGHLYKALNAPHNHPCFWCVIPPDTMEQFLLRFDEIIHVPPKITKSIHWNDWRSARNTFDVVLDKYHIHFIHNKLSSDSTPTQHGGDIHYKYAYVLTIKKWFERLQRMPNEPPKFIISEHAGYGYNQDCMENLATKTKFELSILTNKAIHGNHKTNVIPIPDGIINNYSNGRTQFMLDAALPVLKQWV